MFEKIKTELDKIETEIDLIHEERDDEIAILQERIEFLEMTLDSEKIDADKLSSIIISRLKDYILGIGKFREFVSDINESVIMDVILRCIEITKEELKNGKI